MKETKRWVRITAAENIPLREGRAVQVGGHVVAIFNLGDRFLALENRCPHRGGPLADGIVSAGTVVCPLHAWKIDLTTGSVTNQPENPQCVKTFPARVEAGAIFVELSFANSSTESSQSSRLTSFGQDSSLTRISGEA
ncbi:MAG: nitrite reductase small subunit NirD [Candidatus Acidiferrum sp.]